MPELNRANRQVCDVDIRQINGTSKVPFLNFDTANTTTAGLSGDSVYAMAKGSRRIAFPNPIEGTMTIEAQVYPFKLFSLFSDGVIESTATYAVRQTINCYFSQTMTVTPRPDFANQQWAYKIVPSNVFAYEEGHWGDPDYYISAPVDVAGNTILLYSNKFRKGVNYDVGYFVTRSLGVKKIAFNNQKQIKDYYITMSTLDKDDQGNYTPFKITAYKATPQRNFELSFSSESDPATVTLTFDLMEDKDGNILDFTEADESEPDWSSFYDGESSSEIIVEEE